MLMNPNREKKAMSPKSDIKIEDLNDLDNIDISTKQKKISRPSFSDVTSNIFDVPKNNVKKEINNPSQTQPQALNIKPLGGINTEKQETKDGFKTFNEIPIVLIVFVLF